jgi:hypothetical protein
MLQWMIVMPVIALLVERLLEMLDALVTLNLFPWWRSAPPAPPKVFLQRPSRTAWRKEVSSNSTGDTELARVVHTVGSDSLEFPVHAFAEAVLYYEKEKALYGNQLKHYVGKYGHFLPRQADATGELWLQTSNWRLALESRLARKEQVPDVGKEAQFARLARDVSVDGRLNDRARIQTLEKLADYCYLRNRYTYRSFSFLKKQVYLVLGIGLGVAIAELVGQGNLLPADPAWIPMSALLTSAAGPTAIAFRAVVGVLAGAFSQPVHGLVEWFVQLGTGRQAPLARAQKAESR